MTQNFGPIAWVAFYYELIIVIIVFIMVILSFRKYLQKKNELVLYLALLFGFYGIAILFSMISKLINAVWGGVPYQGLSSLGLWWIGRFQVGRFAFVFVILAAYFAYILKVNILGNGEYKKVPRILLTIFTIGSIIYLIFVYQFNFTTGRAVQIYEVIAFVLELIMVSVVYIPFMYRSQQIINHTEEKIYKKSLRSLNLMSLGFILVFVCFLLDKFMLIFFNWAYSVFYFMAWLWAVFAIITAYMGYLMPKSRE